MTVEQRIERMKAIYEELRRGQISDEAAANETHELLFPDGDTEADFIPVATVYGKCSRAWRAVLKAEADQILAGAVEKFGPVMRDECGDIDSDEEQEA